MFNFVFISVVDAFNFVIRFRFKIRLRVGINSISLIYLFKGLFNGGKPLELHPWPLAIPILAPHRPAREWTVTVSDQK